MKTKMRMCFNALILMATIVSCNGESIKKPNQPIVEARQGFNSEGNSFGKIDCPYSANELGKILQNQEKAAWPKIRVTATFGGFNIPNNPCQGCEHCGCCFGVCFEIVRKSKLAHGPLTEDEINNNEVLFDFIDIPHYEQIILIPQSNIDNGDGYFHVQDNSSFSDEVNQHIGRRITLIKGSYQIVDHPDYSFGVVVIKTL